jgi:outer membrane protein OmpA-like peptidoglycan-associated protein
MAGFDKNDITLVVGKGKINSKPVYGKAGNAPDRKVDIIINRPIDTPAVEKFHYYMSRLEVNETIALNNIQFFRGSVRIKPESLPELNMLIDFMQRNATYKIQLEGHVCCLPYSIHDEPYDESTLSTKRAECIRDSLIVHGINKERLQANGLGTDNPVAFPEVTEEDQLLNRRVEVRIMSK